MPRGSKLLDEPELLTNPETGKTRTVVSKVDKVTAEAAGFVTAAKIAASAKEKPADERTETEQVSIRTAAAQKAAATRAANRAAKAKDKATEKPAEGQDAAVDQPLTPGTTETPGDNAADTADDSSV